LDSNGVNNSELCRATCLFVCRSPKGHKSWPICGVTSLTLGVKACQTSNAFINCGLSMLQKRGQERVGNWPQESTGIAPVLEEGLRDITCLLTMKSILYQFLLNKIRQYEKNWHWFVKRSKVSILLNIVSNNISKSTSKKFHMLNPFDYYFSKSFSSVSSICLCFLISLMDLN